MTDKVVQMDEHVAKWWRWFGIALFLLVPSDLLTTMLAVTQHGPTVEANPVVQGLLQEGLYVLTGVNIIVVGLVAYLFHTAIESVRHAPPSHHRTLTRVVNLWIALLLIAGIALIANNLLVLI